MITDSERFLFWLVGVVSILSGFAGYNHLNLGGWSIVFGIFAGAVFYALICGLIFMASEKTELLSVALYSSIKWVFIGFFAGLGLALANWVLNYFFK